MGVFLAEEAPHWHPLAEADLRKVIDEGLLRETHYLDIKREVAATDGERNNIARHLASLAIDGGALLIGVEEDKQNRRWTLTPQRLDQLAERVEQIATHLIDPPLFVTSLDIPSDANQAEGYLFVEVPPSARAPHMVGGVYFGRGDRTRTKLSDAEVVRLHSRRESQEVLAERMLAEEIARDPVPKPAQQTGRLYVVAQPLTARRDVALDFVRGDSGEIFRFINSAEDSLPGTVREFPPGPGYANNFSRRAQGMAMCSSAATGPGRTYKAEGRGDEEDLLDIELREDGGVRVLMGRMTPVWGRNRSQEKVAVIADGLAVAYARRVVHWAAGIGKRTGYHGPWIFGIEATGLRGLMSSIWRGTAFGHYEGTAYDAERYREVTTATRVEMLQQPWAVADRLVGRLVRGLGSDGQYNVALKAPVESE